MWTSTDEASLATRPYALYLSGQFCGTLANTSQAVIVAWEVHESARATMSVAEAAFVVGMIGLAQFLPLFALTLVAGETADRHNPGERPAPAQVRPESVGKSATSPVLARRLTVAGDGMPGGRSGVVSPWASTHAQFRGRSRMAAPAAGETPSAGARAAGRESGADRRGAHGSVRQRRPAGCDGWVAHGAGISETQSRGAGA